MHRASTHTRLWLVLVVVALLGLTAVACGPPSDPSSESGTSDPAPETGESEGLWTRIKGFFGEVTTRVAAAPVIGAWFQKILDKLAPERQWCAGGVLVALVAALVVAAASTGRD